MSTLTITN